MINELESFEITLKCPTCKEDFKTKVYDKLAGLQMNGMMLCDGCATKPITIELTMRYDQPNLG